MIAPSEPGHVGLEDDPELLGLAGLDLAVEVLERRPAAALAGLGRGRGLARLDHRPGFLLVGDDPQDVAGLGHVGQAEDDGGGRRPGLGDPLARRVLERPDLAVGLTDDDHVADPERAGLDDRGRDRSAALVELGLDDRPDRGPLRVGLELLEVGHEQDHVEQVVEPEPGLRRDGHERRVAAVLLDDDVRLGQLGLDPVRVGVGLVDLVEGDDDRHLRGAGVVDRLERLGHHAVVGGDDDDRDVGDPGAAGAHRRERLVAGRVEEDDPPAVLRGDLARPDVLGDPAALAGRDLGRPDRVEQARLAVVDVAHDGHDRGPGLEERRLVLLVEDLLGRLGRGLLALALGGPGGGHGLGHLVAELAGDERRGVAVDELVDRREDPALDQLADDVGRVDAEQLGELLDRDRAGQLDRAAFPRVRDLDRRLPDARVATLRLPRAAPAAGAAPTPRHAGFLLRSSSSSYPPAPRARRGARPGGAPRAPG